MYKNYNRRFLEGVVFSALAILSSPVWAALDLATLPLLAGTSTPPNIMVAVDDSGSMDSELLFPTDDGALYWDKSPAGYTHDNEYNKDRSSNLKYVYLFPNGCSDGEKSGKRTYCADHYAVPPIPAFAFARAPDYNKAYFDPSVTYDPWATQEPADPAHAFSDPIVRDHWFDLTADIRTKGKYKKFRVDRGMTLPKGTEIYDRQEAQWRTLSHDTGAEDTDWPDRNDRLDNLGIRYFPATFYLKNNPGEDDARLPDGWIDQPSNGDAVSPVDDAALVRYEIKRDNFTSDAAYNAAIQNFANWFTYYRKRHLATRGSIAAAFDPISNIRAGSCTINKRQDITMRDLNDSEERRAFYDSFYNFNFSNRFGTPNREGLNHVGRQLEESGRRENGDIITSACQRNFAILFTDGYNSKTLRSEVGNIDGNYVAPFADDYENTIADVAMEYYKNLDTPAFTPGLLPVPSRCDEANPDRRLNCAKDLHMTTFGVAIDQKGTIFNNFSTEALRQQNADPYANPPDWPDPIGDEYGPEQIDDLWHATINSRGALLNAKTPEKITDAFSKVLDQIVTLSSAASGVTANAGRLTTDSVVYRARFGGDWHGELAAYRLGGELNETTELWEAGRQLDARAPDARTILTTRGDDGTGARFRHDDLDPSQQGQLSQAQLNYIRGDRRRERDREGGLFRVRTHVLGDIVHSTPTYVGAPNRYRYPDVWSDRRDPDRTMPENAAGPYSDATGTSAFAQRHAERTPMIYVGANDGMLHGFDADIGAEKLAYVPALVIPELAVLTEPSYTHRYFVDATPAVGDVVFDDAWHSVLVASLGRGGAGVLALDVTDPSAFSESRPDDTVLWEYTDAQLGRSLGKPSIVRLHNGRWAAMFSNGYNSDNECAFLFLVDIETGERIRRLVADQAPGNSSHCHGNSSNQDSHNGLSEVFPVDLDGDFVIDYAYAGDLHGRIWKFDLTSATPATWAASKLFTATDANGNPQPITTQPQVGLHPYGRDYGVMVYFGTGKYLEKSDATRDASVRNSFYGVWDPGDTEEMERSQLVQQTITATTTAGGKLTRILSNNPVKYQDNDDAVNGWVIDLPEGSDELIIDNAQLRGKTIAFSTTIPSVLSCKPGGSGFFMLIDAATGGRTEFPAFDLDGDHQFEADDDTVTHDDQQVSVSGIAINQNNGAPGSALFLVNRENASDRVVLPTSDGSIVQFDVNVGRPPERRISWREIRH